MHWNVPPDALPGSATLVRVLDRWLNDCVIEQSTLQNLILSNDTGTWHFVRVTQGVPQ